MKKFMPVFLILLITTAAEAVELSAEQSASLERRLKASTNSQTADLAYLSCSWQSFSPATICAYTSADGRDRDSFAWQGNAVARILRIHSRAVYEPETGIYRLTVRDLRCAGGVCSYQY